MLVDGFPLGGGKVSGGRIKTITRRACAIYNKAGGPLEKNDLLCYNSLLVIIGCNAAACEYKLGDFSMSGHSKWNNIKRKRKDRRRPRQRFSLKIGREIAVAVKEGGGNPASNSSWRL